MRLIKREREREKYQGWKFDRIYTHRMECDAGDDSLETKVPSPKLALRVVSVMIDVYADKMDPEDVVALCDSHAPFTPLSTEINTNGQVITLACYQGPDTIVFCAGKNT